MKQKLELRAVNFDNAIEVESAIDLLKKNLATEFNDSELSKYDDCQKYLDYLASQKLVSILVKIETQVVAHIAFNLNKVNQVASIFAPAIDKSKLHFKSNINDALWRALSRLSKTQGWSKVNFSSCYKTSSMSTKDFRAHFTKIIPSKKTYEKIITLRDQIDIIPSNREVVESFTEDFVEVA